MKKFLNWVLAAIHQELAALFPGTTYTDRGCHDFDSFPLSSVPRKRNNT